MHVRILIPFVLCLLFVVGCGPPRSSRPKPVDNSTITWPELQEFTSDENLQPILVPAEQGIWREVAKYLKSESFKSAYAKFSATTVPEEFASDERKKSFETYQTKFKELMEEAEKGANKKKMAAIYSEIDTAYAGVLKK